MKSALIAGLAAGAAAAPSGLRTTFSPEFKAFVGKYQKQYLTPEETSLRAGIFEEKLAEIHKHNSAGKTWTKGVNKWSDLTGDEWRAMVVPGRLKKEEASNEEAPDVMPLWGANPTSVNWTAGGGPNNVVADAGVKDQGQCGSCWAFATTVAVEGAHALSSGTVLSLSEQQIVSCDTANGNAGCNGGDQLPALKWLAKQPGQCTEADYPYTSGSGKDGKCETKCTPAVKISSGVEVPKGSSASLETAIANYPLSLSVDASDDKIWQSYSSGVITVADKCSKCNSAACLDHGVGGLGYGTTASGVDYWQVKNSWSSDWGMGGYILLERGPATEPSGVCGVLIDNQYAVI